VTLARAPPLTAALGSTRGLWHQRGCAAEGARARPRPAAL